jgi:hypothetical protein
MGSVTVFPSFISVQAAKPSKSFGTLADVPIKNGTAEVLTRAKVPDEIPAGSVITSALFMVAQNDDWAGAVTIGLHRNETSWLATETWNGRPAAVATATGTDAHTGSHTWDWWAVDVTDDIQAWLDKTIRYNWGWVLRTNSATLHKLRGKKATSRQPHLVIEYVPPAKVPANLSPQGGAVSVAKPVLTFSTSDGTESIQVQIDAAADAVTPDFDSGEVAATGGKLNLAATAYAGLADGSTTYWRARAKSAAGWSAWSSWVSFSRDDLGSVALTAPTATPGDTTPPFAWTFTGGTQQSWQADILDPAGKILRSSGRQAGTADDWTATPLEGDYFGKTLTARIRVWDDVVRIATPGAATYVEDTVDYVATFTGTVDPMDDLTATQPVKVSPGVLLTGSRAAGIPDEVAVFHDGVLVARLDGADCFTSSTDFEFTDWWCRMGREVTITLVPVVNGEFADDPPEATITPRCSGLWLVDPATGTAVVLWGVEEGDVAKADLSAEHQTTDGRVIRRRLSNGVKTGSERGDIFDAQGQAADDTIAALEEFETNDAGTVYRLIDGQLNTAVIAGNFLRDTTILENLDNEVFSVGSFSWWESKAPTYVDGG